MEAWGRVEAALAAATAAGAAAAPGSAAATAASARVATLSAHAQRVYGAMPADLQTALLSAPARAAMLGVERGSERGREV